MSRLQTLPSGVRVLYVDPQHIIGMFHDVQLCVSKAEPSLVFLRSSMRLLREEAAQLPGGLGLLIVLTADARPPGEEAKDHLKRMYPEVSSIVSALARVVEGEGFAAAAKRSAISIIDLAMRLKCPSKVFGKSEEAVVWLLGQVPRSDPRPYSWSDVVRALRELRAHLDQTPP